MSLSAERSAELSALPVDPDVGGRGVAAGRRQGAQRTILLAVAFAGAAGALARYGIGLLLPSGAAAVPWSVVLINLTGSFLLGVVLVLVTERFPRARLARPLVATGFLGAYTTFSTYAVGVDLLLRRHDFASAGLYCGVSLVGGMVAAIFGIAAGRFLVRLEARVDEQLSS